MNPDADRGRLGNFIERRPQPPAGGVPQHVNPATGGETWARTMWFRGAVSL